MHTAADSWERALSTQLARHTQEREGYRQPRAIAVLGERSCALYWRPRTTQAAARALGRGDVAVSRLSLGTGAWRGLNTAPKGPESRRATPEEDPGEEEKGGTARQRKEFWEDAVNIPNALTMTRLVLTPGICWLIWDDQFQLAIVSFWVAGFFDWLDGYLARRWQQESVFGSFLDPLADKVFVGLTMVTLIAKGLIPLWLGILIVGRDALLIAGSFYIRSVTRPKGAGFFDVDTQSGVMAVQASSISKWNTLFQFGLIWFTMTHCAFGLPTDGLMPVIWAISGGSTVLSGADYLRRGNWRNIFKPPSRQ
ncbi:Cardiolipin synthase (CMP-forming) (CLS) [Durusdinium trenchii]|uniref:Cardiolipin synthase (CMP-forming) (CLS) n=1 Tax=Durusdinium trenchii TaxID=1381693 RepID=A0ABP0RAI7_9DINO